MFIQQKRRLMNRAMRCRFCERIFLRVVRGVYVNALGTKKIMFSDLSRISARQVYKFAIYKKYLYLRGA